jgi:hypothetical protein
MQPLFIAIGDEHTRRSSLMLPNWYHLEVVVLLLVPVIVIVIVGGVNRNGGILYETRYLVPLLGGMGGACIRGGFEWIDGLNECMND